MSVNIPSAPEGVKIDNAPRLDYLQASAWFADELGMTVNPRFIRTAAERGALKSHLLGRKRFMATADLWAWATTKTRAKRSVKVTPFAPCSGR